MCVCVCETERETRWWTSRESEDGGHDYGRESRHTRIKMADVTAVFWLETIAKMAVPTQHGSLVARWRRLEVGDSAITHFRVCANKYTSGGNMAKGRASHIIFPPDV